MGSGNLRDNGVLNSRAIFPTENFIDREGRIVTCEHATSSITRMEPDGRYMSTLGQADYDGKQLNSPNDVIVDSRGRIWFTDPLYGRTSKVAGIAREPEMGFQGVYCILENGELVLSRKDFEQPNGLCMEIGEKTMLVNDTPEAGNPQVPGRRRRDFKRRRRWSRQVGGSGRTERKLIRTAISLRQPQETFSVLTKTV